MTAIPDKRGRFGPFGGRYVPETLIPALDELTAVYQKARRDPKFRHELDYYLREYVGRPTPLYYAESAKISVTRVRTKSITRWAKFSWRAG